MNFELILPQQIIFGKGTIKRVAEQVNELGGKRILIITSKGMQDREGLKYITCEVGSIIYSKVEPDPSSETVIKCAEFARKEKADLVVGFGGGSVMDVAKKVATDLGLPKIMIPTTAGSGSEVTHEVVFKVDGKKQGFTDKKLVANVAIVDPNLLKTLPQRKMIASAFDALSHSIESYQSKRGNDLTRALSYRAYEIIVKILHLGINSIQNNRVHLSDGSLLAGIAFGNSGTTLCHALSYPLSNKGIPHGEAVAIMLPYSIEFNGCGLGKNLANGLKMIARDFRFEAVFGSDTIEEMAKEVMEDERHLSNNPVEVKFEDVAIIYKEALS